MCMSHLHILIGSPICQQPCILKEFLTSLEGLYKTNLVIDYFFIDDNKEIESKSLLDAFAKKHEGVLLMSSTSLSTYQKDNLTHTWTLDLLARVTQFKNKMIEYAVEKNYDYLFLIDSDLVLHPRTLHQLISDEKDIVSAIFWTKWNPNDQPLPQVWVQDFYEFHDKRQLNVTDETAIQQAVSAFVNQLQTPGVYKVGGLGACTLISQKALLKGVNFNFLYNISFNGEDRHFCIRAVALGLELFVDTYYPAYHIYRQEDLEGVAHYKANYATREHEVLAFRLLSHLTNALDLLCTLDYETPPSFAFLDFFTHTEGERQKNLILDYQNTLKATKLVSHVQFTTCNFNFSPDLNQAFGIIQLNFTGYKGDYSFFKTYECAYAFVKEENGTYLINHFSLKNPIPLIDSPLIRRAVKEPTLTLSMVVKNEENRYLEQVLHSVYDYIDCAVIIDDASTDSTIAICKSILKEKLILIENRNSMFNNEVTLRKLQWEETIKTQPDWILFLDADELFEDRAKNVIPQLIRERAVDAYTFRLYDFWCEDAYREDTLWHAHHISRPFMIRYQPYYTYTFTETAQHCGRMPNNVLALPHTASDLRIKHYGWARASDRLEKYYRYMSLDPQGLYGNLAQYNSILDQEVNLVKWQEKE